MILRKWTFVMARVTAGELRATRISQENEFNFYLSFTKRIILGLPDIAERMKAALWVKSLRDRPESQLRTDYIKLLLFALQRKQLIGPFRGIPPEGKLEPFPEGSTKKIAEAKDGRKWNRSNMYDRNWQSGSEYYGAYQYLLAVLPLTTKIVSVKL